MRLVILLHRVLTLPTLLVYIQSAFQSYKQLVHSVRALPSYFGILVVKQEEYAFLYVFHQGHQGSHQNKGCILSLQIFVEILVDLEEGGGNSTCIKQVEHLKHRESSLLDY